MQNHDKQNSQSLSISIDMALRKFRAAPEKTFYQQCAARDLTETIYQDVSKQGIKPEKKNRIKNNLNIKT